MTVVVYFGKLFLMKRQKKKKKTLLYYWVCIQFEIGRNSDCLFFVKSYTIKDLPVVKYNISLFVYAVYV